MNSDPNAKLGRVLMVFLVLACFLGAAIFYTPLIRQNERTRRELVRWQQKIEKEDATAKSLKTSIDALRLDPRAIERLARERLRYAKPGEVVFLFEPASTNVSSMRQY